MARLITRQEAARILDVSTQTVSNWIEKGYIKAHMLDNHLMIDRETIEQHFDSLQDLAHLEKAVAEKKEHLRAEEFKLDDDIRDYLEAREELKEGQHGFYRWVTQYATMSCYEMFTEQERKVYSEMMGFGHTDYAAEKLGLTRSRVLQIFMRCLKKIADTINLQKSHDKWEQLEKENQRLTLLTTTLRKQLEEANRKTSIPVAPPLTENELIIKLVNTPLVDFNFAVKSIKILKGLGCKTIGEVACLQKERLMNVDHCGRKTVDDIEKVLAANGLSLGTDLGTLLQVPIK